MIGHTVALFGKDSIPFVQALVIFVHFMWDYFADIPDGRVCIIRATEQCRRDVGPLSASKAHVLSQQPAPHTWFPGVLSKCILHLSRLPALGWEGCLDCFSFLLFNSKCKHSLIHFISKPVITKHSFSIHQCTVYIKDLIEKLVCEFKLVHIVQIVEDEACRQSF